MFYKFSNICEQNEVQQLKQTFLKNLVTYLYINL
jgi:hypothetical protein